MKFILALTSILPMVVAVNENGYYELVDAASCGTAMITSEEECKEAILDLGLPRIFAGPADWDDYPRGCWCFDFNGVNCYMNTHPVGKAEEHSFALCQKFSSSISSWVYPNAAILDIDGRSGHTSFGFIGAGACRDADGNHYDGKHSSEVASPTACQDFCLSVGYTNGLVGFQWSSSDNTCNCSIDAHVYGSGSGTGRMGDPNGQAGSTCFERRYAIISEDVLDDDRASGSVTSTGPNDDDRANGSVTSTGPNDDDRASDSVTSTGPNDDDRASGSVTSTGPNDDDRASGSVTSTVNSLRTPKKNTLT